MKIKIFFVSAACCAFICLLSFNSAQGYAKITCGETDLGQCISSEECMAWGNARVDSRYTNDCSANQVCCRPAFPSDLPCNLYNGLVLAPGDNMEASCVAKNTCAKDGGAGYEIVTPGCGSGQVCCISYASDDDFSVSDDSMSSTSTAATSTSSTSAASTASTSTGTVINGNACWTSPECKSGYCDMSASDKNEFGTGVCADKSSSTGNPPTGDQTTTQTGNPPTGDQTGATSAKLSGKGIEIPTGTGLPDPQGGIAKIIRNLLTWLLGIVGVIAIIGFVISGIQYLTSAGDEDQMQSAKRNLLYSIIGVVVVLASFVIIQAIQYALEAKSMF